VSEPVQATAGPRPGILYAFNSWRVGAVALLSFSSGMPLGVVWIAIPTWLKMAGFDTKTVALITLAQVPWSFKIVWAPLMDRYVPPFLGRKRGWIAIFQVVLTLLVLVLASQATEPDIVVIGLMSILVAFASASQDIAIDGYAVEVLVPGEHGAAVGARTGFYRAAMYVAGALAISVAGLISWKWTLVGIAALTLLCLPVTIFAPEPLTQPAPPKTLLGAVWEPLVGFLSRPRALELLGFMLLFNLSDNLATSLIRPFLVDHGYDPTSVGFVSGTVGLFSTIGGTVVGALLCQKIGVGRALWLCGGLQGLSNLAYAWVAAVGVNIFVMSAGVFVETFVLGMCAGSFGVFLIRMTSKRFSATQFALFSSVFAIARTFSGPVAGALADALGWRDFFLLTVPCAVPGLFMLQRFAPWGKAELVDLSGEEAVVLPRGAAWGGASLGLAGTAGLIGGGAFALLGAAALTSLKHLKAGKGFDYLPTLWVAIFPASFLQAVDLIGAVVFGLVLAVAVPAYLAARGRPVAP
jgi:PAT family beta-lactamase induction signal transducer AmpG